MPLEKIYFFFIALLLFLYLLLVKRRVDIFTLIGFSLFYYYLPLFFGDLTIMNVVARETIVIDFYVVISIVMSICLVFVLLNDLLATYFEEKISSIPEYKISSTFEISTLMFLGGLFLTTLISTGPAILGGGKTEIRESGGGILSLLEWMILIFFSISLYEDKKLLKYASIFGLLFSLSLGSRSVFTIGLIVFLLFNFSSQRIYAISKYKHIFMVIVIALFVTSYKLGFKSIREGDIVSAVINMLSINLELFIPLFTVDANSVVYNLNTVMNNNIELDIYYVFHRLISFFPMASSQFSEVLGRDFLRFSDILNIQYHVDTHWGLASSILGEVYAMGGLFLISVTTTLVYSMFLLYNFMFFNYRSLYVSGFLPVACYIAFYSHRVDITFVIGMLKNFVFIMLITVLINSVFRLLVFGKNKL